jgi:hypothetical protein
MTAETWYGNGKQATAKAKCRSFDYVIRKVRE